MEKPKRINYFKAVIPAKSVNESYARSLAASFAAQCDPTIEELSDIKTVISEAVTNCIVHAYIAEQDEARKKIVIEGERFSDDTFRFSVRDYGCGIPDIKKAIEPLFTTSPESERSGMGFSIMESFTDSMRVYSKVGKGTRVVVKKKLGDGSI